MAGDADSLKTRSNRVAATPTRRLAGWIPTTMLDWPGKVASTLFLSGCGFRCPFCHNPRLLAPHGERASWAAVVAHLRTRRDWLDGVVVTGGEPTDDPDLPSLLSALAEEGMPVKLDTNGSRPQVLRHLLAEGLVGYVAMDVKAVWTRYAEATGTRGAAEAVAESVRLLVASGVDHEFRTTVYPGLVSLEELPAIAGALAGGRLYALQQFRPGDTLAASASDVRPYDPQELRRAARLCNAWLPTIVRGAGHEGSLP